MTNRLYRNYIKRFLDIVLSADAIVVLSPVMAVTAVEASGKGRKNL